MIQIQGAIKTDKTDYAKGKKLHKKHHNQRKKTNDKRETVKY